MAGRSVAGDRTSSTYRTSRSSVRLLPGRDPGIASHGGYVDLVGVEGPVAYIQLGGGCQGCGLADVTLKQGIEVAVKEAVPEIEEVADATDHDAGTNPYFQPSKK